MTSVRCLHRLVKKKVRVGVDHGFEIVGTSRSFVKRAAHVFGAVQRMTCIIRFVLVLGMNLAGVYPMTSWSIKMTVTKTNLGEQKGAFFRNVLSSRIMIDVYGDILKTLIHIRDFVVSFRKS